MVASFTRAGNSPPSQRAARPDDDVGLEPPAVVQRHRAPGRPRDGAFQARPVRTRPLHQRLHREGGAHDARLGLEQRAGQVVSGEAGVQAGGVLGGEPLDGDAERAQRAVRGGLPAVLAVREPHEAAAHDELLAGLRLELRPQRPRPARGRGVVDVLAVPQRIRRDSPPEVARGSPGANWSTIVTSWPARASHHASEAPKLPAPTTIASIGAR